MNSHRLCLRRLSDSDRDAFARLHDDPLAMRHYPRCLSRRESDRLFDRLQAHHDKYGFGFMVASPLGSDQLLGIGGVKHVSFEASFTPACETGWILAPKYWGNGYATEIARRSVDFAFRELGLEEIVSFTTPRNWPSRRVMVRSGFTRRVESDFLHPSVPDNHPLSRHVLYATTHKQWASCRELGGCRPARVGELAALQIIDIAAGQRVRHTAMAGAVHTPPITIAKLTRGLCRGRLWVAHENDQAVGFALVSVLDDEQGYLEEISVDPCHAGKGIGEKLIRAATEWARAEGRSQLWLRASHHVAWNQAYCERLGFVECRERKAELNTESGVAMRLDIEIAGHGGLYVPKSVGLRTVTRIEK